VLTLEANKFVALWKFENDFFPSKYRSRIYVNFVDNFPQHKENFHKIFFAETWTLGYRNVSMLRSNIVPG
jgi:hypothetical protein